MADGLVKAYAGFALVNTTIERIIMLNNILTCFGFFIFCFLFAAFVLPEVMDREADRVEAVAQYNYEHYGQYIN